MTKDPPRSAPWPTDGFDALILPHLGAAYRLALWVVRDDAPAQDIVQDSYLKAYRAWGRFQPGNAKAWILTIVRRQALNWLRRERLYDLVDIDDLPARTDDEALRQDQVQDTVMITAQSDASLHAAIDRLAPALREVILLKEFEALSYREIAEVLEIPMGTVMSRLSRAREALKRLLMEAGHHDT
jgi:RNA polymerase sigma factor (sigma-70 family)